MKPSTIKAKSSQNSSTVVSSTIHPKRITYIDCLKGFATLLVVIGHVLDGYLNADMYGDYRFIMSTGYNGIYLFHMALFFMISGFVYHTAYFDSNGICKRKKVRIQIFNLIYTYVLFSLLMGAFKIVMGKFVNNDVTWVDLLLIFMKTIPPYWYLYVLLVFYFAFSFLKRSKKAYWIVGALVTLLSVMSLFIEEKIGFYFEIKRIFYYSFFFFAGIGMHYGNAAHVKFKWLAIGSFAAAVVCIVLCRDRILSAKHMTDCISDTYVFKIVIAFGISCMLFWIFKKLFSSEKNPLVRFLRFIGQYSLEIYVIHCIFTAGNRVILPKLHITNFWLNIPANVILSTAIPILFAVICKKMHLHGYIFRPATMIAKKMEEKLKCTTT